MRNCCCTVYPKKCAHRCVVLCFVVVMQSFVMNSHEVFIHIHQGCFAGTGAIVRLPQCQWSKPDGYGKISQCITTTKHSKAKTVCIFLGIYCMSTSSRCNTNYAWWLRHFYILYPTNHFLHFMPYEPFHESHNVNFYCGLIQVVLFISYSYSTSQGNAPCSSCYQMILFTSFRLHRRKWGNHMIVVVWMLEVRIQYLFLLEFDYICQIPLGTILRVTSVVCDVSLPGPSFIMVY